MAESIFKGLCESGGYSNIVVKSAGLYIHSRQMMPTAREALLQCGEKPISEEFIPTQFHSDMVAEFDYIITMNKAQAEHIGDFANVYTVDELSGCGDVLDPYMASLEIYTMVCKQLQNALIHIYKKIVLSNSLGY